MEVLPASSRESVEIELLMTFQHKYGDKKNGSSLSHFASSRVRKCCAQCWVEDLNFEREVSAK